MKKAIIVLLLLFATTGFAQGLFGIADYDMSCIGTTEDTTAAFELFPYMTVRYAAADSIAQDSVDITCVFEVTADTNITLLGSVQWETLVTYTISVDSTVASDIITDTAIQNYKHGRFRAQGGTDNRVNHTGVTFEIMCIGWTETRRR